MTAAEIRPGTAEQLARVWHMHLLEDARHAHLPARQRPDEARELVTVARWIIGAGDPIPLLAQISDDLEHLWYLLTDDWEPSMLDELTEDQAVRRLLTATEAQELSARRDATYDRLVSEIEGRIWRARNMPARTGVAA